MSALRDVTVMINPPPASCSPETGIGRVALAQYKYLPELGIRFVDDPGRAEVIACHVNRTPTLPRVDVLHLHGLNWSDTPHWPYAAFYNNVNRMVIQSIKEARAVTVPSQWVAQPLRRDFRLQPMIIGHGIEPDDWAPGENLGYVLWNKNRNSDVCDPTPAFDLAMHGVPVLSTFTPRGKETAAPPEFKTTGLLPAEKMRLLVVCADVYLATTMETFGIGTLEALAAGVPVLGFDWGGTAELVRHGIDGYLVPPGDSKALLDGLAWIKQHRKELSANAMARAREFTWPAVAAQYAELYQRLAQPPERGVAVVVPCYNYAHFLRPCLMSLLSQTRKPDEIIVVDDASTDDSRAVALEFTAKDPRVQLITFEVNQGVAAARNAGIKAARSPLVVCLDADDALAPEYVAIVAGEMERDPSLGIAYTGLAMLHESGELTASPWPPEFDWQAMGGQVTVPPSNCIPSAAMFRREMWRRAGGYRQEYAPAEDTEFWVRGLSTGWNCRKVTTAHLFAYRPHAGSASRRLKYKAIDRWLPWMRDREYPMGAPDQKRPIVRSYALPEVSVIIPVGPGHAPFLPQALDSLLGQTFRNWEAIVIDDEDGALEKDPRLAPYPFIRMEHTLLPGYGAGVARNIGLQAARAPLVLFLDADDWLAPQALEKMLGAYAEGEGRYVYTDWVSVAPNGRENEQQLSDYDAGAWLERLVTGRGGLNAVTILIATADARRLGFNEELPALEDSDFMARCAVAGVWGKHLAEPLLYYRLSSGSRRQVGAERRAELNRFFEFNYGEYLKGTKLMSTCCGGSASNALLAAKKAIGQIRGSNLEESTPASPPTPGPVTVTESAMVRMEFIGEQRGPVTYFGNENRNYRGADAAAYKFANVHPADVSKLEATGVWKRIGGTEERAVSLEAPVETSESERRAVAERALLAARREFAEREPDPELVADLFEDPPPATGPADPELPPYDEDEPPEAPFEAPPLPSKPTRRSRARKG